MATLAKGTDRRKHGLCQSIYGLESPVVIGSGMGLLDRPLTARVVDPLAEAVARQLCPNGLETRRPDPAWDAAPVFRAGSTNA